MSESSDTKYTYFYCLRNIENWLKLITHDAQNATDASSSIEVKDIDDICSHMITCSINKVFNNPTNGRSTAMMKLFNTLIRIYAADKSRKITSRANFHHMVEEFTNRLESMCDDLDNYMDYATGMFDSLLLNFSKNDFIIECIQQFFPDKPTSETDNGSVTSSAPAQQTVTGDAVSQQSIINNSVKLTTSMLNLTGQLAHLAYIQWTEKFSHNYQPFMKSLLKFLSSFLDNYDKYNFSSKKMDVIHHILILIWNLSDKIPLVPMFIDAGYASEIIEWLGKISFKDYIEEICEPIMNIVYNLSRHEKGLKALRSIETLKTLMKRKSDVIRTGNFGLIEPFSILLITLLNSGEEQKENEDLILKLSEHLLVKSKRAYKQEDWRFRGYHLSEYLYPLQRAFSNTRIIQHILGSSPNIKETEIKFFVDSLCSSYGLLFNQDRDDLDKLVVNSLMNIILCISNYGEYRSVLCSYVFFHILIETLAKQSGQDVAKRIWCNLQIYKSSKSSSNRLEKENPSMIYVSYNWTDKKFCEEFVDKLKEQTNIPIWVHYEKVDKLKEQTNIPIWVHYEKADELQHLWEYLEPAIDAATIVIILASIAYSQSKSNYQELNYIKSWEKSKSIIIVETVSNFQFNREWMHSLLTGKENIPYNSNTDEVVETVANHSALSRKKNHSSPPSTVDRNTPSRMCTVM